MAGVVGGTLMSAQPPAPPMSETPLTERWAPTEWGANDKAGSVNRTTPAMVMNAMRHIPAFGPRGFSRARSPLKIVGGTGSPGNPVALY